MVFHNGAHVLAVASWHNVEPRAAHVGECRAELCRAHPHGVHVVEIEARYMAAAGHKGHEHLVLCLHKRHFIAGHPPFENHHAGVSRPHPQCAVGGLGQGVHQHAGHLLPFRQLPPLARVGGKEPLCAGGRMRLVEPQVAVIVQVDVAVSVVCLTGSLRQHGELSALCCLIDGAVGGHHHDEAVLGRYVGDGRSQCAVVALQLRLGVVIVEQPVVGGRPEIMAVVNIKHFQFPLHAEPGQHLLAVFLPLPVVAVVGERFDAAYHP